MTAARIPLFQYYSHIRTTGMKIPPGLIAPFASIAYRLWCSTLRLTHVGILPEDRMMQGEPMVVAIWHDELFTLIHARRKLPLTTIVSRSSDGEYLARLLQSLGIKTARGSSTRGGSTALLQAVHMMREEGCSCVITVDGPRGPRHVAKSGAILLAHKVPACLLPIRIYPEKPVVFRSWDRFQLPLPFSRVHIVYGEPYLPSTKELTEKELEREREELEQRLNALQPPQEAKFTTQSREGDAI